jgi:protein-S-isoprenylcysteine O-methyltransferase Ste14/ADP-ribose pyrophosphatase YjhB (NUDIX family)
MASSVPGIEYHGNQPVARYERIPEFGTRVPGRDYVSRPSAYVIVRDRDGRIAVVRTPVGVFLPGGGQHPLETPEETVVREAREECGLRIEVAGRIGVADQYAHSAPEATSFAKRSTFLRGTPIGSLPGSEPGHELHWLPESEADRLLSHESHRWAIAEDRRAAGRGSGDAAAVRVFPPGIPLAAILLGVALNRLWPVDLGLAVPRPERYWLGGTLVVGAILVLGVWSVLLFRRGGQSENPWKPTPHVEQRGPFRVTRNPMYLQMVVVCFGFAILLMNWWVLALTPLAAWGLQRFAILPEEAYLERKFGEAYLSYKKRVPRWL